VQAEEPGNHRRPAGETELRYWLENMILHHHFTTEEVVAATGLTAEEVTAAVKRLDIRAGNRLARAKDAPLLVLPYPGGRHPRIGFLDGAVRPQRETKVSVFTPWDEKSYVVADVPEAVWSNLGLTYLAHTHVPTVWSKQGVELAPLEWNRREDGTLDVARKLPNGIEFGVKVVPMKQAVRMELWLTNGTREKLTDMRVQNCVMLKGAAGFTQQNNDNKLFVGPYAACRSEDGKRWVITGWLPLHRGWANAPCPCLHSDPKLPDCEPGKTVRAQGWLSFYEGEDVQGEIRRIDLMQWWTTSLSDEKGTLFTGEVVGADGKLLPARVYIRHEDGRWFFARSKGGSAVEYRKERRDNPRSVEMHTSLTAHAFEATLPPGKYTITVERGKEYHTLVKEVTVGEEPVSVKLPLERWINMEALKWYSGETHVHRTLEELPTLQLAEDLNVAFPLTYWVTQAYASPRTGPRALPGPIDPRFMEIDRTHGYYPLNTEYEIFTVDRKAHTLGAFFALNHKTVFDRGVPPVKEIARQTHREGGLIELDKHNWPWSMALVPVMPVDLYELSNNHVWRTEFGFPAFGEPAPEYMQIEKDAKGFTEKGWIDYGFQNYYALLNCGFRLRPTAGTASGVHPVPLGFGRVYVHFPEGLDFDYEQWLKGLNAGRSFVTTGPMAFIEVDGKYPGHTFKEGAEQEYRVTGSVQSAHPLKAIEVVVNGEVARTTKPDNRKTGANAHETAIDVKVPIAGSSWIVVRCYEALPGGRVRFAHTAPWHIEVAGKPLRPRKAEVEFLIQRVRAQIERSGGVLPKEALDEYREALGRYEELAKGAR
jgi:hypothetical protein